MFNRLLPRQANNAFAGYKPAVWIFGVVVAWKAAIAAALIFNGYTAALVADGVPLDTFPPHAAQAFVTMEAAWGLGSGALCAVAVIVLLRYRTLVPLMFIVLLTEQVLRRVIFYVMPIARIGTPPEGLINLMLTALMVIGLALSLMQPNRKFPPVEPR